jgi:phosphate-selective porin
MNDFGFDSTPATPDADGILAGIRKGAAADAQFAWGPLDVWLEYFRVQFEPDNGIPAGRLEADGYYAQAAYYVWKETLQAVVKYESFDPGVDLLDNRMDIWTFGLNYYIRGHDLKLQLNYLLFDPQHDPDERGKVLLRMQAVF